MRTSLALGVALFLFVPTHAPSAQVAGSTQQVRPGMPARDAQQEEPTGTAIIRGRIVAGDTGAPLRRAQIRLSSPELRGGRTAQTDGEGRYEFRELPAGRYTLSASKAGYVNLSYGQRRPFEQGRPIELLDAQVVDKADFSLPRGSAITGRVLDEFGEPVAEAMIQAMRYQFVGGQRRLTPTGRGGQTNDLGQYRIFGLPPGEYYVSATLASGGMFVAVSGTSVVMSSPGGEEPTAYAPTYYPGTANPAEASRVPVAIGQETGSVDFQLLPVRAARITGMVLTSAGRPAEGAMVMLMPRNLESAFMLLSGGRGRVAKDGTFALNGVVPGTYTLQVRTGGAMTMVSAAGGTASFTVATRETQGEAPPAEPEFAMVPVTIAGQDITGLTLTTGPGGRLSGEVVFEDGPAPAREEWQTMRVMARPASDDITARMGQAPNPVAEDGSFEVTGVAGNVLIRPLGLPQGWTLKAVEYNGRDITDAPIEFSGGEGAAGIRVVLTALSTEVSGSVTDDRGRAVNDYTVVVFAEDSAKWTPDTRFISVGRPNQDGRFSVKGLPPADYLAVALDYVQQGEWYDPSFLDRVKSQATSFRLGAGGTKVVELKISEY